MKILSVNIPKTYNDNGVEDIVMNKLQKLVLIAGKNGSGKTRILRKIQNALGEKPTKAQYDHARKEIDKIKSDISYAENDLKIYEAKIAKEEFDSSASGDTRHLLFLRNAYTEKENVIARLNEDLSNIQPIIDKNLVITDIESDSNTAIPFVPRDLDLIDCNSYSKNDLLIHSANVNNIGISNLSKGSFAKIQLTQDRWFNATHPQSRIPQHEKDTIEKEYDELTGLIQLFIRTKLGRNEDGEATLFGLPLGKTYLSDGQSILIQLCIAIFSQEKSLNNLVLFLDEPENHLHPSIILDTIDRLISINSGGQVWISTHSIPLLAHYDPQLIWYVENNSISYAGSIPEKVLRSLLGTETDIAKLQDFISLPAQYAINRYAFECLQSAGVVTTGQEDPQMKQATGKIITHRKGSKIKIMDYGSGKGRLLSHIYESYEFDTEKIQLDIDYVAYDSYDTYKKDCLNAISLVYKNPLNHYFNDMRSLLSSHDKGSFDIIVLCNVLHEIDPKDWLKVFDKDHGITALLKDSGSALIIEDNQMPIGEMAYQKGFIVLNTPEFKELFHIPGNYLPEDFSVSDARGDGRLKAHKISKKYLEKINAESRVKALKTLKQFAEEQILDTRQKKVDYSNGKKHAFWVQQFANSSLAIRELTN